MRSYGHSSLAIRIALGVLTTLLAISVACAAAEPTPTPVPPARPAPPIAPTVGPQPTVAVVPEVATPVLAKPTPTRVLPTATPVVASKPAYGGTLRYAYSQVYDTLDPAYQLLTPSRRVLYAIYNNLVQMNPDGTIGSELAKSWDFSPDGKIVTFHLQEGIKFHDGTALDARAIKWNFDRFLDPKVGSPRGRELSPPLERVEIVGDQSVQFRLSTPFRPLMSVLTVRPGQIASPTAVQKLDSYSDRNGDFGRKPVGSGSFKFKEWILGSHVTVVRNENYWEKGLPYLESIQFFLIPDANVIFAMLRTAEVEVMEELRPSDEAAAERDPNIGVTRLKGYRNRVVFFKTNTLPWDNKALRQAFAYAMDRKSLVDVLYGGQADIAYHPIARAHGVWFDPTITVYEYDPAMAKQKLAEAGYPNGFSYVQPCRSEAFDIQWCETAQAILAKAGVKMTIRLWVAPSYYADWVAGKYTEPTWSNLVTRVDPHRLLQEFLHSNGPQNEVKYKNPEFDRLVDEAAGIYDVSKAKELYRKAIGIMLQDSPMVFTVTAPATFALRSNVKNFAPRPDGEPRVRELWLAR